MTANTSSKKHLEMITSDKEWLLGEPLDTFIKEVMDRSLPSKIKAKMFMAISFDFAFL